MTGERLTWYAVSVLLMAGGMWLMLPRGRISGRMIRMAGAALALGGLAGMCWHVPRLGTWLEESLFWVLALVTIVSAAATVTFRSPVYCAIWFAMTLLGTSGLFFFQGAEFLAVATMVVYAGAILVTFLFVLMLAEPEGHAFYDRVSWEAPLSAAAGAVMMGILTMTMAGAFENMRNEPATRTALADSPADAAVPSAAASQHMARLGAELFGRHLIAVEVAGTLLLAALVGAAAIVMQGKQSLAPGGGRGHG